MNSTVANQPLPPSLRIIMAVTNDLVTDQRVDRSCMALTEAGCEVTLVGRNLPSSQPVTRPYRTERMNLVFRKKAFFYAEYNLRLFLRLLFARTDVVYANDTDTLLACFFAARLRGKPLFFDAHEMFPEVPELVGRQRVKRFWERIEQYVLPKIARRDSMAASTVCQSIADIYRERYGISMAVVRNVPMKHRVAAGTQGSDTINKALKAVRKERKILLYQGAVNVGRGIEAIMEAMPYLDECHLIVAGVGDKYDELRARAEKLDCDNITFLGRLEPTVLRELTLHADLGLSLLENRGLNYFYSFPNRIADFVQASVPVLATDFPEIRRIVDGYHIGTLVEPAPFDPQTCRSQWPEPVIMASIVRNALGYWSTISDEEKERRFSAAAADLTWDNDKKILLKEFGTIIKRE